MAINFTLLDNSTHIPGARQRLWNLTKSFGIPQWSLEFGKELESGIQTNYSVSLKIIMEAANCDPVCKKGVI